MRDWATPCKNASLAQVRAQVHLTYADDRLCDRCRLREARAAHPTSRGTSPGFSSPAVSAPTVPAPRTARRGGSASHAEAGPSDWPRVSESTESPAGAAPSRRASASLTTLGDGFLSEPRRPGGQFQAIPSRGTGPFEGRAAHRPT